MSRWEFMRQLEELLFDISPNEREEALQYYNDYFNDAGRENEKEVLEALGSPQQVAKIVKDGLSENVCQGEFTETGFTSTKASSQNAIIKRQQEPSDKGNRTEKEAHDGRAGSGEAKEAGREHNSSASNSTEHNSTVSEKKETMPTWAVVLIVIACILLSPAILGAVCTVGGTLLGIIAAIFGVILGFGVAALVFYVVAAALFVAGIGCILVHPAAGIGLLGGGCICVALGILSMLLVVFLAGKCVPGICQGIAYIFKKLFGDKGGAKA
ncbi:MAG: DUF1700 domain-containing protein [Lachnospiraceae bacterium]|nr:DUF1700 domain-containing protein [Lachnospiraceae bacterium]